MAGELPFQHLRMPLGAYQQAIIEPFSDDQFGDKSARLILTGSKHFKRSQLELMIGEEYLRDFSFALSAIRFGAGAPEVKALHAMVSRLNLSHPNSTELLFHE